MSMLIKKRQLVMAALVVVLAAAVFVNWYYTQSPGVAGGEDEATQNPGGAVLVSADESTSESAVFEPGLQSEYFAQLRLERTASREEALGGITAVLDGAQVSSDIAESAAQQLDDLTSRIKIESDIETIVSAKLGCECIAVSSDRGVQIVVERGVLNDTAVIQIKDAVLSAGDIPADGISIMEAAG